MNKEEQSLLIKMAEEQFKKIKVSKKLSDKNKAFGLMESLLETYLNALEINESSISRAERKKLWDKAIEEN